MSMQRALRARERAAADCRCARAALSEGGERLHDAYREWPLTALGASAGLGLLLAQLRVGGGLVRAGARIAAGPLRELFRESLLG